MLMLTEGRDPEFERELEREVIRVYERVGDFVFNNARDYSTYIELYSLFLKRYEEADEELSGGLFDPIRDEVRDTYGAYIDIVGELLDRHRFHHTREEHHGRVVVHSPKGGLTNVR